MKLQKVGKSKIKGYWGERLPQVWYSNHERMTMQWFNELEWKRYKMYYQYLPGVAEFDAHAGEKVLEIGVGVGTDLVSYAKNGAIVSGIDLTENSIDTTKTNLKLHGLPYDILRVADAEKLPFEDNYFDLVYSFGVLHHTPRPDLAINEICRVLKDHGKAIIMLYARGWKHYFKRVFVNGLIRGQLFKHSYENVINTNTEVHGDSPLTYVFKRKEIEDLFQCFCMLDIRRYRMGEYFDYRPYGTRKCPDFVTNGIYLLGFEKWLGENFIIKVRKENNVENKIRFWQTLLKP